MRLVTVMLLPIFRPGDPAMADTMRKLAGKRCAVLQANHGSVVAAKDLQAAFYTMQEQKRRGWRF